MSRIELSDIVARSLLGVPELLIEHDEKGMFLQWDSLEIELATGIVTFKNARTHIATLKMGYLLDEGVHLRITGLEGRMRIEAS
jgi:hypothetical protein